VPGGGGVSDSVMVPTVTGEVRSDELGMTLMHEHIFILAPELEHNYPEDWREEERVEDAARKLQAAKKKGIDSIVDLTVLGLGRDIPLIQRVAERVEINIVVATGAYVTTALPLPFVFQDPKGPVGGREVLIEFFQRDIYEGIASTGVRAAAIKCASDVAGLTHDVERVLRATAQVHLATNLPIFTHTDAATKGGLEQQRIFREEGVDLGHVIIGHCGDTSDVEYLRELLQAGSYLGMDRFGLYNLLDFETRLEIVARLCAEGWTERLILSHDTSCYVRWGDALRTLAPKWEYTHIVDEVLPALRKRGVSADQIEEMMVGNPRRVFEAGALRAIEAAA
jgi:phosphotriesterase-related protein